MKKIFGYIAMCAMLSVSSLAHAQEAKTSSQTLPNGATSLTETYGTWTVNCGVQDGQKACAMFRQEVNAQNQPVLSMNVSTEQSDTVSGILIVPFGVLVSKPIHLQIDDSKLTLDTSVRTCVPGGCVVPVSFNKAQIAGLRAGKQLKMSATSAANGEPKIDNLYIQLDGFGGALDRLTALKK